MTKMENNIDCKSVICKLKHKILEDKLKRSGYKYKQFPCLEYRYGDKLYQRRKYLAKGGFAYCFLYQNGPNGHQMVAKVSSTVGTNPNVRKLRWLKESKLLASIEHDNIVKFYRSVETSNLRYILMEYLPSNLLDEHNREKTMHIAKVRTIMRDIFGGLEYLHDCGIIHRDIKMSNILLTYEKRAKICDFGMSVKLTDGRAAVIAAANACGTPNYMPPELCSTNGLLSTKADIWSSGVVMYAILVGVMPFGRRTDENVHLRILECSYEIPNYLRHHPEMQTAVDLLQQILVIEPFQRPSVQQLLNDRFFEMNS